MQIRLSPTDERSMRMSKRTLKELNLLDNFLFGTMVTYPEIGERFSRHLLETILQRKLPNIKVTGQKVIYGKDTEFHGIRLDVEIKQEKQGEVQSVYDIEPDLKNGEKNELPWRTRYYHSIIDSRCLKTSTDYSRLPEVYVIMITPFDPFNQNRMVYTVKSSCVEAPEMEYEDGRVTIYLYTKGTEGNPPQELQELLCYLEETDSANAVNSVLRDIEDMVEIVRQDAEVTTGYMVWMESKEELIQQGIQQGVQQGVQQGIKIGEMNSLADAIIKLLSVKGEVPDSTKDGIRNISDKDKLDALLIMAARAETVQDFEAALKS